MFLSLSALPFAIFFFIVVPAFFFTKIKIYIDSLILLNILEGCVRLGMFLCFLTATLLMPDMRRVYMYHGAEHKTVFAWEDGQDLTVENVKNTPPAIPVAAPALFFL